MSNTLQIAEMWSRQLGLARSPLFSVARDVDQRHHALLDGVDGSFALSSGPFDVEAALDWTWSSQLATHVSVDGDTVIARQVASGSPILRFKRGEVDRNLEAFLSTIISKRLEPAADVVQHIIGCFRSYRHLLTKIGCDSTQILNSFLGVMAEKIGTNGEQEDTQGQRERDTIPAHYENRLHEELQYNRLSGRRAELSLTMRHAAGMVFQEAHAELLAEPPEQLDLLGLPIVAKGSTRNQLGAYFTPPGLARTLADLAIADHLDRDELRIVDPACGSGIFLCEVLRALERHEYKGRINLLGLDVSDGAVALARFALAHGGFYPQPNLKVEVRLGDFLQMGRSLNADVVLMNPPFRAMPDLAGEARGRLQQILGDAFRYRPDLSMAFTSLAQHHLRAGGTLATLLPAGALSQEGGIKWRDSLLHGNSIQLLALLGDHGLFRDAIVNVAALVLRKTSGIGHGSPTMLWVSQKRGASNAALRRLRRWQDGNHNSERTMDWSIYPSSQSLLADREDWTPRPNSLGELPKRLHETTGIKIVEALFHVELGVRAGNPGKAFQIDAVEFERLPAKEKRMFRPVAETRSIRNGRVQPITWIFYPKAPLTAAEIRHIAPKFYAYHLEKLRMSDNDLVDLERPRRESNLRTLPRIVARAFLGAESFAVDKNGAFVVVQGYSWFPKELTLNSSFDLVDLLRDYVFILNSRVFFALLRESCRIVGGGQVDGAKNQIRRVPLPDLAAMYLETPELQEQGRVLRVGDDLENPPLEKLDTFAAAAYRTELKEWSLT